MKRFVIDADRVATSIADAIDKGKGEITVPWFPYRFTAVAQAIVPGLFAVFAGRAGYHRGESR